ncbi:hypothetical protein KI387_031586, partial [Taxus chinensis]
FFVEKDTNAELLIKEAISITAKVTKIDCFPKEGTSIFEERLKITQDAIVDAEIITGKNSQPLVGNVELLLKEQLTMVVQNTSLVHEKGKVAIQQTLGEKGPATRLLVQERVIEEVNSTIVSTEEARKESPLNINDQSEVPDHEKEHPKELVAQ